MSKKNKLIIAIIVVLVFCSVFIILTRKFGIIESGYKSLNLDNNYCEISCEFVKTTKFTMTQEEDISKFIVELNSAKVRKTDFIDEIIDKTEPITNGYRIEMKKEDGNTDVLIFAQSTEDNIGKTGYIFYNGVRYKIKGKLPEYILYLLDNYKMTKIKYVNTIEGVGINMDSEEYSVNATEIAATISNTTNEGYTYGEKYYLEYMQNEMWHLVLPKEDIIIGVGELPKNTKIKRVYDLNKYYDLEEGKYRIVEEITDISGNKSFIAGDFTLQAD